MSSLFLEENIWWNKEFKIKSLPINIHEFEQAINSLGNDNLINIQGLPFVGKTFFVKRIINELLNNLHIQPHRIIYINGETFEDYNYLQDLIEANSPYKSFLIIDDFNKIINQDKLKVILDKYSSILKIIVTRITSREDMKIVSTKKQTFIELMPLEFKEFVMLKEDKAINKVKFDELNELNFEQYLEEFMNYGGLPGVIKENNKQEKTTLLKSIISKIIGDDPEQMEETIRQLAVRTGELLNISEIADNVGLSRYKTDNNISKLEDLKIVSFLPSFDTNIKKTLVKSHKIFLPDLGFRNALIDHFSSIDYRSDKLNLLLNFSALALAYIDFVKEMSFFRTTNQTEINFIINKKEGIIPIQIMTGKSQKKIPRIIKEFSKKYKDGKIEFFLIITENLLKKDSYEGYNVIWIPIHLLSFWNGVWN